MKTRINLYLEELKPKREFLVLKNVVLSWGALIFVLTCSASVLGYFYYSSQQCSAQLNQDTFLKELCSYSIGDRSPFAV